MSSLVITYRRLIQRLLDSGLVPRARFLKRINRFIVSRMTPDRVEVDGHTIYIDRVDSLHLAQNRNYEPLETAVVREHVKPGDMVLDIGANIGYYSLLMARQVGREGHVIAVEPDAENCALLEKNLRANGYDNTTVKQMAVTESAGRATLYRSLRSGAQHSIAADEGDPVDVETISVGDLVAEAGRPVDFVKIDIEGAEMKALRGAARLLAQPRLMMMIEFNPRALAEFGEDPSALPTMIEEHGFLLHDINRHVGRVEPVSVEDIVARYNTSNGRYTNLYCRKG